MTTNTSSTIIDVSYKKRGRPTFYIKSDISPLSLIGSNALGVLSISVLSDIAIFSAATGGIALFTTALATVGIAAIAAVLFFINASFFNLFGF